MRFLILKFDNFYYYFFLMEKERKQIKERYIDVTFLVFITIVTGPITKVTNQSLDWSGAAGSLKDKVVFLNMMDLEEAVIE